MSAARCALLLLVLIVVSLHIRTFERDALAIKTQGMSGRSPRDVSEPLGSSVIPRALASPATKPPSGGVGLRVFPPPDCNGSWTVIGTVGGGSEALEHIVHWRPEPGCGGSAYRRFESTDALRCLQGRHLLFYGNSNTRTLYIALEALLKNASMTSRVAAKQLCDNSKTNHSCWVTVEREGMQPVSLHYISYVGDLHSPSLLPRLASTPMFRNRAVDVVLGNAGLNVIQMFDDAKIESDHRNNIGPLRQFVDALAGFGRSTGVDFYWHTTTRVCSDQPHFRRYRYNPKHWRHRSIAQINQMIGRSNAIAAEALTFRSAVPVTVLDGWALLERQTSLNVCPLYDDPLHHRFLDRELIQVFLNQYCR